MATYTITINERTQIGRSVLHLMRELSSVFTIKKSQQSKEEANMSKEEFFAKIDDARASIGRGEGVKIQNAEELHSLLNSL